MRMMWVVVVCAATVATVRGQGAAPAKQTPAFEVVSIKLNTSGPTSVSMRSRPDGGFTATNIGVGVLLGQAYPQLTLDMIGLPDWAASARFDVNAVAAPGFPEPTLEQRRDMYRGLLVERFKLKTHVETRDAPAFDLVLARSDGTLGPRLTRSDIDCAARAAAERAAAEKARKAGELPPPLPDFRRLSPTDPVPPCTQRSGGSRFDGHMTMADLATTLRLWTGRVVVDKTGLKGYFNLAFEAAPPTQDPQSGAGAASDLPSIFTAVQEQLGLRLVSSRAPVEMVVIDHIERPTEN